MQNDWQSLLGGCYITFHSTAVAAAAIDTWMDVGVKPAVLVVAARSFFGFPPPPPPPSPVSFPSPSPTAARHSVAGLDGNDIAYTISRFVRI